MANKSVGLLTIAFGADLRGFDKAMKKAQRNIKKFGASMQRTGKNLTRNITLPIIGLGAVAVKTFMSFEQSMLKVKAVSGATAKEFKALTDNAKKLGASTMFTASEVAGLQFELAKLGFSTNEINASTESILRLSQATTHDLAESGEIVASTLKSFNLEAAQSTKVADIFALASSNAAMDMQKLSVAMPTVGATANAVGVPLEELTAQMMVLADRGIEASTMGTHLRKVFVELATKGISFDAAMQQINDSTNKVKTATDLFGKRAFATGLILAENTHQTSEYENQLRKSAGTSRKMAEIMDSGTGGALRRLKSAMEGVAIDLGQMLIPLFEKLMNIVQKGINFWKGLNDNIKNTVVTLGLIAASIGPILTIIGSLTTAFSLILSPVGAVVAGLTAIVAGFIFVVENYEAFKERLSDWTWWRNALVEAAADFVDLLGGRMGGAFGISDKIRDLKVDSKEYIHEFGSFADAIKNQAKDLAEAMGFLSNPFSLGGGGGGANGRGDDGGIPFLSAINPEKFIGPLNQVGETIAELTQKQKQFNAAMGMFENIMTSALTSAAYSTEGFFKSFIENLKIAIKQLMVQLAVIMAIKLLLGDATTVKAAFELAKGKVLGLATGGLVTGPTMALVGEGAGTTASNPEVVAPLDKLKGMLNGAGGVQQVEVYGRISGNDIFISNQRGGINRLRTV